MTVLDPKPCAAQRNGTACGTGCGGAIVGAFVSATAFHTDDAAALSAAIARYAERRGVTCEAAEVSDDFSNNTLIFQPLNGWTVVFWPERFIGLDVAAVEAVTTELKLLASLVFVEEGRYWAHVLVENGDVVDQFCPRPTRMSSMAADAVGSSEAWKGSAALLARKFGVAETALAPYLRDLDQEAQAAKPAKVGFFARFFAPEPPPFVAGPAFPDDEYDLDDYDVFVDFWRRAGIHWPADMELAAPAYCWRFGDDYPEKLRK